MKRALYMPIAMGIAILQMLPLPIVAILGRTVGYAAWWLCWGHRRVALSNLQIAFGEQKSSAELHQIARENFRRLGESFLCALKTADMESAELDSHLQIVGGPKIRPFLDDTATPGIVVVAGHFGNIEMYGEASRTLPWVKTISVYRPSRYRFINRVLEDVRKAAPVQFFNEQTELKELRKTIRSGGVLLGMMGDCHPGAAGRKAMFFGQKVATSIAPLVQAQRFGMPVFCAACFRTGLGKWRVELSDRIETRIARRPRPAVDILNELNQHLEIAIRRDPANWCWVLPRWENSNSDKQT